MTYVETEIAEFHAFAERIISSAEARTQYIDSQTKNLLQVEEALTSFICAAAQRLPSGAWDVFAWLLWEGSSPLRICDGYRVEGYVYGQDKQSPEVSAVIRAEILRHAVHRCSGSPKQRLAALALLQAVPSSANEILRTAKEADLCIPPADLWPLPHEVVKAILIDNGYYTKAPA